jgi:uncharacterized SAM-binding protein YcdF (DUF218 family)
MFVLLSKLLPLFIYPVGIILVLLIAALLVHRQALRRVFLAAALLVLLMAGNHWTAVSLVRSLERRYLPPAQDIQADAIVLLGGGTEVMAPPRPIPEVNGAGDRVIYAAQLYRDGQAPFILATGGRIAWSGQPESTPAQEMAALLEFMGIPEADIVLEANSQNTYENAAFSAPLLSTRGAQRILLVTSAMHMPRAVGWFEAAGFEVIPAPTDYIISDAEWQALWHPGFAGFLLNSFPSAGSLNLTTNAIKEYIGLAVAFFQIRWVGIPGDA